MLLTTMDLLNYQYMDKMNNNIGLLCYEGNFSSIKHVSSKYNTFCRDCCNLLAIS